MALVSKDDVIIFVLFILLALFVTAFFNALGLFQNDESIGAGIFNRNKSKKPGMFSRLKNTLKKTNRIKPEVCNMKLFNQYKKFWDENHQEEPEEINTSADEDKENRLSELNNEKETLLEKVENIDQEIKELS